MDSVVNGVGSLFITIADKIGNCIKVLPSYANYKSISIGSASLVYFIFYSLSSSIGRSSCVFRADGKVFILKHANILHLISFPLCLVGSAFGLSVHKKARFPIRKGSSICLSDYTV